jgi:hypothetical protein
MGDPAGACIQWTGDGGVFFLVHVQIAFMLDLPFWNFAYAAKTIHWDIFCCE